MSAHIFFTADFNKELSRFLQGQYSAFFVLADENTFAHCYRRVVDLLPVHQVIQIKPGEANKTLDTCRLIWEKLTEANADRKALLINLGGGMVGDIGGFAAGCYKRGIEFINIPTTLLAMVDASVGGKTGIDFMGYKNQVGLFNEPAAVLINTAFLGSLPHRELVAGFAEVIKHYIIADKAAFEDLAALLPKLKRDLNWDEITRRNVAIKSGFVEKDRHEHNIRKALNFGHTVGHAVESYFLSNGKHKLLHGECVATGMIAESFIAAKLALISQHDLQAIVKVIRHYFNLPALLPEQITSVLQLMKQDKKNERGKIQFALPAGIGNFSVNNAVEEKLIIESLDFYNRALK